VHKYLILTTKKNVTLKITEKLYKIAGQQNRLKRTKSGMLQKKTLHKKEITKDENTK
jgi:hypothetical protein